jgi:hypothetical protein
MHLIFEICKIAFVKALYCTKFIQLPPPFIKTNSKHSPRHTGQLTADLTFRSLHGQLFKGIATVGVKIFSTIGNCNKSVII